MIIRSKAPLRLGLAGGGTDVSPYSEIFGGAILNATVKMYAHTSLEPRDDGKIVLQAVDQNTMEVLNSSEELEINGKLDLLKGVYNRIVHDYVHEPLSFTLSTFVDAPPGSGLGSSSTLVVSVVGAFCEWLRLPLGDYDIAYLSYEIERKDLSMAGGKQDQYAATFGGFNFMEFYEGDKVVVNPLRIKKDYLNELEFNFVLFYTGTSRVSSRIIADQSENVKKAGESLEAMHGLKEQAHMMKEAILKGEFDQIGQILDFGWQHKKNTARSISNPQIDEIYEAAMKAGAAGGKISGAGGGGFMFFYCPGVTRYKVIESLKAFNGQLFDCCFDEHGMITWRVKWNR